MGGETMIGFAVAGLLFFALAGLLAGMTARRHQRLLARLDEMLDSAISGEFTAQAFDEAQASKLEAKMAQFLSSSRLKKEHTEDEKQKIHALISDISHQTKTPVAAILLYAQLLSEREPTSSEGREYTEQIAKSAEKLSFLIQELMKSSRLESGMIAVQPRREDIGALAAGTVSANMEQAEKKGVSLRFTPPAQAVFASADLRWCAEALHNLVDNGVKYTPAGGAVRVSVKAYELFACVQVQDTGKGIAPENLPKVCGRFWRAPDSQGEDGLGIGLFLAREIVSACGGYLKVSSETGRGACFSMFLPREA